MKTRSFLWSVVLGSMAVAAVGCGGSEGAGPSEAGARVDDTIDPVVTAAARSIEFLDESTLLDGADRTLRAINQAFPTLPFRLPESVRGGGDEAEISARAGEGDESPGQAAARWLREVVFTEANYEGDGVYLLGADDLCGEPDPTAPDDDCAATVTALQIRVRATLAPAGIDLDVLIGSPRDVLVGFELRSNSIAVVSDLAQTGDALRTIATVVDAEIDLPTVLEGVVAAKLTVNGEADVALDLAVRSAVRVEGNLPEGGTYAFATAARDPWLHGRADGVARQLELAVDVGTTRVALPWASMAPDSLASGAFELVVGGLTAATTITEGDDALTISGISLGDGTTTAKLDGHTLVGIDLSRFDLTLSLTDGGVPQISVSPAFDLSVALGLAPLAAAGDEVESWLLDETYHVALTGSSPAVQPIEGDPGMLAILGDLTISSTAAASPITATTGQCLVGDAVTAGEHPVLGALTVIDCP